MRSIDVHAHLVPQSLWRTVAKGDVWFAPRIDIANWWLEHHEDFER